MTNRARLLVFASCLLVSFLLFNCSDPLDLPSQPSPIIEQNTDTLFAIDTVLVIDTVSTERVDTVIVIDTTEGHTDTLIVIDTVIEIEPDTIMIVDTVNQVDTVTVVDTVIVTSDTAQLICGRIEACQKEIVWLLQNDPGEYRLSFASFTESDQPPQSLTVEIGDDSQVWSPAEVANLVVDSWLDAGATIRIKSRRPPAYGHAIYVCLSLTRQ